MKIHELAALLGKRWWCARRCLMACGLLVMAWLERARLSVAKGTAATACVTRVINLDSKLCHKLCDESCVESGDELGIQIRSGIRGCRFFDRDGGPG